MAKVYIGNLPANVKEREVEDLFYKFGRIRMIDIKGQGRGPCFGFVEYEDPRDAEEAVRRRDGVDFYGYRIRVEIARGGTGRASESFRPPRSAGWRVIVKGLPHTASWQDLKDFIRKACTPMFVDVVKDRDGNSQGVVEFESEGDMRLALRKLDDTEFRNPRYDAGCYLRLIEESASSRRDDRARSRSRSPRRSRGRSGSPMDRDRSRDRERDTRDRGRSAGGGAGGAARDDYDRGASPARDRSRSRSRDRSPDR